MCPQMYNNSENSLPFIGQQMTVVKQANHGADTATISLFFSPVKMLVADLILLCTNICSAYASEIYPLYSLIFNAAIYYLDLSILTATKIENLACLIDFSLFTGY